MSQIIYRYSFLFRRLVMQEVPDDHINTADQYHSFYMAKAAALSELRKDHETACKEAERQAARRLAAIAELAAMNEGDVK